ncbi:hypothetical protein [Caballeronia sp. LZ035]|uniref:hypothetical protein n=1 Tax=Caballeronia sp. LZ035 TaxID=3038568 RepID=UPI00285D6E61|nr:hypothetical protein [Caballeronia sp. LZ035]MDR5760650.1 hypothetical protein [Caballeronia sp. LZ035]
MSPTRPPCSIRAVPRQAAPNYAHSSTKSPQEARRDRDEADTRDVTERIRAARLGLFRLPPSQGGAGATLPQLYELVLDLAAADSNIPHILRNHFAFVEKALRASHLPQYARWLERIRNGELFGLGASEIGTQNVGDSDGYTLLVPRGDAFSLTGITYHTTGNLYFDHIVVNAKTPEGRFVAARVGVTALNVALACAPIRARQMSISDFSVDRRACCCRRRCISVRCRVVSTCSSFFRPLRHHPVNH